mgnify:CR=1 FL=1
MKKGTYVIVRCKDAGVHCGEYRSHEGREVRLRNARRIWRWKGAMTLSDIAISGLDSAASKLSPPVKRALLLDACEILSVTDAAKITIDAAAWAVT